MRTRILKSLVALAGPALIALAGCGNESVSAFTNGFSLRVAAPAESIDTNCTGCNAVNEQGGAVARFTAAQGLRTAAVASWSVAGGDAVAGPGLIDSYGRYKPPSYLTADQASVTVTARLASGATASRTITVRPGFLQPLTPQNAALGAGGSVSLTGYLAVAGGTAGIDFSLAEANSGQGSLSPTRCQRSDKAYTFCTATYTAPSVLAATRPVSVVATATGSGSKLSTTVLLNTAGVNSSPVTHQAQQHEAILLGSSGGNNNDYDTRGGRIADCCGGTLGALVQDPNGRHYLLSNNHVLARSDRATAGDPIVQPGLIDNSCTPYGEGPGTRPVATLTGWLPLRSSRTNADAAIAQVATGAVDATGSILELGARQSDGTLAAAPPGISSSGGHGQAATLRLQVAKSGRTTGLTCASVSALHLDVRVDYYQDCAETKPYLSKTFTNQLAISGNQFSDAGDSGALLVDASNAEPVGLYFAGGLDASGVSQGVASPAAEVLDALAAQTGAGSLSFVGTADHAVHCLNYGDDTVTAAQAGTLSDQENKRAELALAQAHMTVSARAGILGVALGKSSDHPGEAALIVYVEEATATAVPAVLEGLRTVVIPTTARAVAAATAPKIPASAALAAPALAQAVRAKEFVVAGLMRRTLAFFAVGVGQSLDNPREAALVVYVDRKLQPAELAQTIGGLRTRYVVMDRLHVTRAYATPSKSRCLAHP